MRPDTVSNQSAPTPRTDPLIVDRIKSAERLARVRAYVENHGAIWSLLADGGYQITFPAETLQWLTERNEHTETYTIQFPDTALMAWHRNGQISSINGWPQKMSYEISLPSEK